jgi:hypothetical protein
VSRTRLGASLLAAVIATTLCGCAGLEAGPAVPPPNDWTTLAPPQLFIEGVPVSEVTAQSGGLHASLGIQVYWNSVGPRAKLEADANRIFNYVVGLGANSVAIDFSFYTNGEYPSRVYGVPGSTPSPATIAMVVANAREHGLRVLVRPLLNDDNIKTIKGDWRGSIKPRPIGSWFESYYRFLRPYLAAAQASGATAFGIDTELDSLAPDRQEWVSLQAAAAKLFKGQLTYAVNYGLWQEDRPDQPVPDAALDAYPLLGLTDSATAAELTTAWVSWLRLHRPEQVLKKTVLQEVGIAAFAGAYAGPALTPPGQAALDVPVQQKWFAAACAAAKETGMPGIYFFDVNSSDDPADRAAAARYAPGSFIDRSDGVIKACFASGWS